MPISDLPRIQVNGPFWSAEAEVIQASTLVPRVLLSEDFESYPPDDDPDHWHDTEEDNRFDIDDTLFRTQEVGGTIAFGTTSEDTNIHSHYSALGALHWTNYVFTGRMFITEGRANSGIGVTFFSRYPEERDHYYRLRKTSPVTGQRRHAFHIAPHPHHERRVKGDTNSGVIPENDTWYRFHIEVTDTESRTVIRAKVWADGTPEPDAFQIDAYDDSEDRLRSGTVGLWSARDGEKYFDDLQVYGASVRLPDIPQVLLAEHFEFGGAEQNPKHWRDTRRRNSHREDDRLFRTKAVAGTIAFGTTSDDINIHSHYNAPGALHWTNYVFTGRMFITEGRANSGIGVTFFSRYPEHRDHYYRLRKAGRVGDARRRSFHIAPHPNDVRQVKGYFDSGVVPRENTWYRFHIEVKDTEDRTVIRAKVWADGTPEPDAFQIDAYDDNEDRLRSGTVGLWTERQGGKYFDDLQVRGLGATNDWALRNLFVDHMPRDVLDEEQVLVPGSLFALCRVNRVRIVPDADSQPSYTWRRQDASAPFPLYLTPEGLQTQLQSGQLSLLLLEVRPADWPATDRALPAFTCLNGAIPLDVLEPRAAADDRLYQALRLTAADPGPRTGAAGLSGTISVHSSGLSIYGSVVLPWEGKDAHAAAPFQVARLLPDPRVSAVGERRPGFRLSIEVERLTADEATALIDAWGRLSRFLNPPFPLNELAEPAVSPTAVTLEIADPRRVPRIYWDIMPWREAPDALALRFARDEITLLLSDQQPYDTESPPTSLGRIAPHDVMIERMEDDGPLVISIQAPADVGEGGASQLTYHAAQEDGQWQEDFAFQALEVAFNAVETPRLLRNAQNLLPPEWVAGGSPDPVSPHIVWGFLPLADGWAQLPILNLSEQIYLDAGLAQLDVDALPTVLLQGAVVYGNDQALLRGLHRSEQPWSMVLTNAQSVRGTWNLMPEDDGFRLDDVRVDLSDPEVTLNGFVWFSTGVPTAADALPDFDNWISGLQSVPLRTVQRDTDPYPAPVTLVFPHLNFSSRSPENPSPTTPISHLKKWALSYRIDPTVMASMIAVGVLPKTPFAEPLPLVWRRHPRLPMIQVLPLTQSQTPPNHPSASRQLVPFALPALQEGRTWDFGVQAMDGATTWPSLLGTATPAQEWQSQVDLPLASLSIPGLVLDPHAPVGLEATNLLPMQYRFDLPYTDELHALAQLPKVTQNPNDVSPPPDADTPPEPPKPLARETFGEHWERLAERANLASGDAIAALIVNTDGTVMAHVVEPLPWPVRPDVQLDTYPGRMTLDNADPDHPAPLILTQEAALRGLQGRFVEIEAEAGNRQLRRLSETASGPGKAFVIEAGSMAAHRGAHGAFRDQRGLERAGSTMATDLLTTPVDLRDDVGPYELASFLDTITLHVTERHQWEFWFRDLPVKDGTFDRADVISDHIQDVNDPEAHSREHNFRSGYEWRLADSSALKPDYLSLYHLHFYPLTLARLELESTQIARVEIIGRLQLPLNGTTELEEFSNAVRLTFEHDATSSQLQLTAIALESQVGEWPLALRNGEAGAAAHLSWQQIRLNRDADTIEVDEITLHFFLFDTAWTVALDMIPFPKENANITRTHRFASPTSVPLVPKQLDLLLDLVAESFDHTLSLLLTVQLGESSRTALTADVRFPLLEGDIKWEKGTLFDRMTLNLAEDAAILFADHALQLMWTGYEDRAGGLQFLSGMHLDGNRAPGFAALTFDVLPDPSGIPELRLQTAFMETLISCRWGAFLQAEQVSDTTDADQIFASSAGDLVVGYTALWKGREWKASLLLNGLIEVKDLVSWPQDMMHDAAESLVTLPASYASEADRSAQPALNHVRHTIRILLNQHELPAAILVSGEDGVLFRFAANRSWQFLAVVEHQFIDVLPEADFSTFALRHDRRWTVLQEVRFILPDHFKTFLLTQQTEKLLTLDPVEDIDEIGEANHGYLGSGLRNALANGETPELDKLMSPTLLVEASAPHWIKQVPLPETSTTTLQFLPNGIQLGILSSPQDYAPSSPEEPQWLLLTTPFLGRLQPQDRDLLDTTDLIDDTVSVLQVDPIFRLHHNRRLEPNQLPASTVLALCMWGGDTSVPLLVPAFDSALGRLWPRLDPISLEENWFRLQHLLPEPDPMALQSVMATLPDTPARLSRATALRRAFDAFRPFYPPNVGNPGELPPMDITGTIAWRQHRLLLQQGVSSRHAHDDPPYGWHLTGLQILTSGLASDTTVATGTRRYAAATLLPALLSINDTPNPTPLNLAVSPYLGLAFRPSGDAPQLRLLSAELLCLDQALPDVRLRPIASHFLEVQEGKDIRALSLAWAKETHRRLCPESPVAILRFREIREHEDRDLGGEAELTTTYSFAIVTDIERPAPLIQGVVRMRSPVSQLRFREGQFGGNHIPKNIRAFELAPPQVTGVQPVYLTEAPDAETPPTWPWGLSSMRLSIQYAADQQGAVGTLGPIETNGTTQTSSDTLTLWWQAPQHLVQYRSAIGSRQPTAGLPDLFRASAIKGFLPVVPTPPLPAVEVQTLLDLSNDPAKRWQPILPGAMRYLLLGTRSGVMVALRHQLLKQSDLTFVEVEPQAGSRLVSGSVPVQHRTPRPVPLPANEQRETALQTWASYFEPHRNVLASASPVDEAFFAACGGEPARRLRMQLQEPHHGVLTSQWNGDLVFGLEFDAGGTIADWEIALSIVDGEVAFVYQTPIMPNSTQAYRFTPSGDTLNALRERLNSKQAGDILSIVIHVKPVAAPDGFFQTLSLPLRVGNEVTPPLPLEPYFIHFEDPEYNRRLASPSAQATGTTSETRGAAEEEVRTIREVILAADRRAYHPTSELLLRYDWDDDGARGTATLAVQRIDVNGIVTDLVLADTSMSAGQLRRLSLLDLQRDSDVQLTDRETLRLKLSLDNTAGGPVTIEPIDIVLNVAIVMDSVVPVPEAAYALLRWQTVQSQVQVECVRFAWGPQASRIELICPEDLRTEVVRRRAVFQWTDSVRPETLTGYAIQKITSQGATHFPTYEASAEQSDVQG